MKEIVNPNSFHPEAAVSWRSTPSPALSWPWSDGCAMLIRLTEVQPFPLQGGFFWLFSVRPLNVVKRGVVLCRWRTSASSPPAGLGNGCAEKSLVGPGGCWVELESQCILTEVMEVITFNSALVKTDLEYCITPASVSWFEKRSVR